MQRHVNEKLKNEHEASKPLSVDALFDTEEVKAVSETEKIAESMTVELPKKEEIEEDKPQKMTFEPDKVERNSAPFKALRWLRFHTSPTLSLAALFVVAIAIASNGWVLSGLATQVPTDTVAVVPDVLGVNVERGDELEPEESRVGSLSLQAITEEQLDNYTANDDQPKFIEVPELDVMARVKPVSVNEGGAIGVPRSIFDVGFYTGLDNPSAENGVALLIAHHSGPNTPGVLAGIEDLKPGSKIVITFGDDKTQEFLIEEFATYEPGAVDMANALSPASPSEFGLNILMTGGNFDFGGGQTVDRVLVKALRI